MKVVVTGACGRLGSVLVPVLEAAGHGLVATDIVPDEGRRFPVRIANLLNREAVYGLLEGADAVVHLGNYAWTMFRDHQRLYVENMTMNANVFIAASELGVDRVIFASSTQAMSGRRGYRDADQPSCLPWLPISEATPAQPGNPYGASKEASERLLAYAVRTGGIRLGVALRFPALMHQYRLVKRRDKEFMREFRLAYHAPDEGFAYLTYEDAADLLRVLLACGLEGYRLYHPAAPDNMFGVPARELLDAWFQGVEVRDGMPAEGGLVDIRTLTADTGWAPGAFAPTPAGG